MSKLKTAMSSAFVASAITLTGVSGAVAQTKPTYSFNVGITSDYVFRGISQSARSWTGQGGVDMTYGIFYAGLWASGLDFGKTGAGKEIARAEVDLYMGIKPVAGPITFDLGVIYYMYPGARDSAAELNYVELKAGASASPWKDATIGATVFFSPEYTGETGKVWTLEGSFSQVLPAFGSITPTFSALIGYQAGDLPKYAIIANNSKDYVYWNAGVTFGWEKFSLDLRYWDTNISNVGGFCTGTILQCDSTFMGTLKFTY
ncbi:MAG TPA: TorF family putative porin [Hyphomicrobiaceae bacterium]|nr:TorF family putative porin [Hyphomicrobiaceae bacterium]